MTASMSRGADGDWEGGQNRADQARKPWPLFGDVLERLTTVGAPPPPTKVTIVGKIYKTFGSQTPPPSLPLF